MKITRVVGGTVLEPKTKLEALEMDYWLLKQWISEWYRQAIAEE